MSQDLEASYALCQRLARRAETSFYYSFLLLPRAKRRAMYALYAFLRHTDDLVDGSGDVSCRRRALDAWRASLGRALVGSFDAPLFPALADTIARYNIPPHYLEQVLDGVLMDLDGRRYETFDDLAEYCQHVASAVGLACIHVWGFQGEGALEPARQCGLAFQLTNILRDLKEDCERGRVYLPAEDLRHFAYSTDDLRCGVRDQRFRSLMWFEIERAERFYAQAAGLDRFLSQDGRTVYAAMTATYRGLLDEIKRRDGDVLSARVRLSGWQKLRIAGSVLWRRIGASKVEGRESKAEGQPLRPAGTQSFTLDRSS